MAVTVSEQSAYAALMQNGLRVAEHTAYVALTQPVVQVAAQTVYVAFFPVAPGGRRRMLFVS